MFLFKSALVTIYPLQLNDFVDSIVRSHLYSHRSMLKWWPRNFQKYFPGGSSSPNYFQTLRGICVCVRGKGLS